MTAPPKHIDTITLFVEDLQRSKAFYVDVFGLPVLFEDENSAVFRFENTQVNLLDVFAAPELPPPAVAAGPGPGPRSLLTTTVEDVAPAPADLQPGGGEPPDGPK